MRWFRWLPERPTRQQLIERKHQLEGEIRSLSAEVSRRRRRGEATGELENRLERLRTRHRQARLDIDRTGR